jgi:tRNA modification GTPase
VSLLRISGPGALAVAEKVFRGKCAVADLPAREQAFGAVVDAAGEVIDQVLLTVFRCPASYTGEDVVEIGCHGGVLVTAAVLGALLGAGARSAEAGEFSKRAFLNGKMDLTQAEAVMDLISARTSLAMRSANRQLEGELGRRVGELRASLLATLAHVEAYIDFPDEDIDPQTGGEIAAGLASVAAGAGDLIATAEQGRILREGLSVVLAGAPNAGKSSLLNVLLGYQRAIVNETAGTTRDTLEEMLNLKGIPVRLIDTAGLRETGDAVEGEGVSRAEREVERADLVLEVVDGSLPRDDGSDRLAAAAADGGRRILVINKSDLAEHRDWAGVEAVRISCSEKRGIDALVDSIASTAADGSAAWGSDLVAVNARHRACLERVRIHADAARIAVDRGESPEFTAVDIREALEAVGEIVGRADVEELLGAIFSAFCIGK